MVSDTVCIPKFAEATICITVPRHLQNQTVILDPLVNRYEVVAVAGAIVNSRGRQAMLKVLNYQPVSVSLRKGLKIARIMPPHSVANIRFFNIPDFSEETPETEDSQSAEILEEFAQQYKLDINPKLTMEQRHALLNIFYHYKLTLARDLTDVRIYPYCELEINLRDPSKTSYTRQYPVSEIDAKEIDRQITQLKDANLITENDNCSWNLPCFLVSKKSGEKRMVVDLRRVNALIKPVITLLPKPEELLQRITALNPKFMTCSDLFKGFYQQKISRKSRHITSFTNPYTGVSYSWRVLTMGLLSSPSAFIQMMEAVFKNKQ